ncbi:hypothetical protein SSBR45G_18920 [Bradyrhizobium sp. SSBR45G]|uniref:hypothetical protein n=1 Tax=unclassified Bradyrhizobium TaxID=2631580 RepID=UPI0023429D63|nr:MULTISPECIES: hypothetical protein [unclassified Bradyrhizobium]GLH76984.1 hypothetical protein SSBR45G_18920 [Bradyrhizobium sp. SSBR45G]GLH83742.1 hypothetical protein SSBR45R_12020 [Bradyrhizobium sp. SSBR45R]
MMQSDKPGLDPPDPARPPLPRERWKGPPEGAPDPIAAASGGGGCLTSIMQLAGLAMICWGLYVAVQAAIADAWTMGGYLGFFLAGLSAAIAGAVLIRHVRGGVRPATAKLLPASGWPTTVMAIAAVALLLPGLYALVFGSIALATYNDIDDQGVVIAGFVLGAAGMGARWWLRRRPAGLAGLMIPAGLMLLIPGSYVVLYGLSRIVWFNDLLSPPLLAGLLACAVGAVVLVTARPPRRADETAPDS